MLPRLQSENEALQAESVKRQRAYRAELDDFQTRQQKTRAIFQKRYETQAQAVVDKVADTALGGLSHGVKSAYEDRPWLQQELRLHRMERARLEEQCKVLEQHNLQLMDTLFVAGTDPSRWLSVDMLESARATRPSSASRTSAPNLRSYILAQASRQDALLESSDDDDGEDDDEDEVEDDAADRVPGVVEDLTRHQGTDMAHVQRRLSRLSVFGDMALQSLSGTAAPALPASHTPAPPPVPAAPTAMRRFSSGSTIRRASSVVMKS